MAKDDPKGARSRAEERFNKAKRATDEAKATSEADLAATRKKTARLRAERLAKEAAEGATEIDKKPAVKKPKTARAK